jgi:hypothetical protein
MMFAEKMPFNFIKKIAIRMDKASADFALQMKMLPACCFVLYILITGAPAAAQRVFAYPALRRQFFKMPVDGGLPYKLFRVLKMADQLIDRYMTAFEGLHVSEDTLPLAGVIFRRTFTRHTHILA